MWRTTGPAVLRTFYIYLRTRTAVEYADNALGAIRDKLQCTVELLELGEDRTVWDNGYVMRLQMATDLEGFAVNLSPSLAEFDAWAIHDAEGNYVESISDGPMKRHFERASDLGESTTHYSQMFVKAHRPGEKYDHAVEAIRGAMKGTCTPVFYFECGQVMFVASPESGGVTRARCLRHFRNLQSWSVVDSGGDSFDRRGRDDGMWTPFYLPDLFFSD